MKKILYLILVTLFVTSLNAQQFDLSAEIRPRFENRHGYKTLLDNNINGTNFISQRSRINFDFKQDRYKFKVTIQNIRVWGDVGTLSVDDSAMQFHEAWVEAYLSDNWSLKIGRQEIIYDDHRIFGDVGWAQQARSHDAFLFKYIPNKNNRLDIGFALNADGEKIKQYLYSNVAGYKALQYAWYHGSFNKLGLSVLALNTGIEYIGTNTIQTIDYMQTIGSRLTYKSKKIDANAATYFQSGKRTSNTVNALYYTGNFSYNILPNFSMGAGIEYLSGKDTNDSTGDIKSFSPLFGTNHKFNGWMDYFYVGNWNNSVGLTDVNFTLAYKKDKFSAKLVPHLFSAAANVYDGNIKMDQNLGTEIDFVLGYKVATDIKFNAGYSKMYATSTLQLLKGGSKDADNSWAWIMLTFKPKLFSASVN